MTRKTMEERFWEKVDKSGECWEWTAAKFVGTEYGVFGMTHGRAKRAHRVSWFLFTGIMPDKMVLHKCDNPKCVNPEHLFLGTNADNQQDCVKKGRRAKKCRRFKEFEVRIILLIRKTGMPIRKIAKAFNVSPQSIHAITQGRSWKKQYDQIMCA